MEFVAETVAGIAGSRAQRASALDHELRDHAMEHQAVVKRALHFLTGARVLEFLGAFGEADEILDCLGGFLFEQARHNCPLRCVEHSIRTWCAAHKILLNGNSRQALSTIPPAEASVLDSRPLNSSSACARLDVRLFILARRIVTPDG